VSKYNCGLKSLKVGDFDPVTGEITNLVEVEVYKDTLTLEESDPETTRHYAEGKSSPKKIVYMPGDETVNFSVMDTSADSLKSCLGGDVTTLNGVKTWHKPKGFAEQIKALVAETVDGSIITIPRGSWIGKKNFSFNANGILLIDITVTPTETGVADLDAMTIADSAPVEAP